MATTDLFDEGDNNTAYHCTATWHLARLSRAAEMIYSLACVISKLSHQFFCSAPNLAQYLGYERRQIYRGLQELEDAGFLELKRKQSYQSSVYGVVLHSDWAVSHPGCCATKQAFPWEGEGDELGRRMYALSGGRHRFLEHQIKILRKSGFPEELILEEWANFMAHWKPLNRQDARYFFSRFFYGVLRVKNGSPDRLQALILQLYQTSGYVFSGRYKSDLIWMVDHFSDAEIVDRFRCHFAYEPEVSRAIRAFCAECREEQVSRIRIAREARNTPASVMAQA